MLEGHPVKSTQIFIGCTLIFLGCRHALIFLRYLLDFFLIYKYETQLFSSCHPEKTRQKLNKFRQHPRKIRVQINLAIIMVIKSILA